MILRFLYHLGYWEAREKKTSQAIWISRPEYGLNVVGLYREPLLERGDIVQRRPACL